MVVVKTAQLFWFEKRFCGDPPSVRSLFQLSNAPLGVAQGHVLSLYNVTFELREQKKYCLTVKHRSII